MLNWIWTWLRPYKLRLVGALIALIFTAGITLALGQGVRLMIDRGFVEGSVEGLQQALFFFLTLVVAMSIGAYCRFYLVSWLGERVVADIRSQLYQHLITLPPSFFEENLSGEIQSRITTDTTLLQSVIGSSVSFALRNVLIFVGGLVLMLVSNLKLSLIVLFTVPVVIFPLLFFGRKVRKLSRDSQDKVADVGAWAGESLLHIRIVQAFNGEPHVTERFNGSVESAFQVALRRIRQRAVLIALVMLLVLGAVGGMLYIGGTDVLAGRLSGGDLAAFLFYAIVVAGSLAAVTEVYGELQRAAGAADRLRELMAVDPEIQSPSQPHSVNEVQGRLSLQNIDFRYPSRPESLALSGLDLDIKAGERIALVGPSGAGKSTLFDLLLRFRDPEQGLITLDGAPLKDLALDELRSQFALVPQQPVLFSASIRENLRYGAPDATDEEIEQAAIAAHADEFIRQMPEGYDSLLGEQGVKISGGQRQRLAIARAILRDPKILLLDEATSALDAESEYKVQQALDQLMEGRTTLVIAHRLATIAHVDRIVVMDQGKVVASGTHDQLLSQSPLYRRLAELQFRAA
ncbi:ABC transporter transmembrane domain-containing protein [Parendozoicomonas haliclonae]|uniref:Multidrug resistance ABC transporter ATP-binding and permease protein n=1 Tax=Parendozoicomonas haliclonae TaxID=1960125 RepID=A0A1X7AHM6_9GAMM|nr:ABC transporter transmembrane domain-containing protein [Parendozoicomonas haliclonae]SMA43161.1 Multidrug resistance ABC transporter ATP-binding and permease protein [Parendozoicomonas haliclonae]